jgi:dolichyl-diphosphooligosaccharide--protein glycosyltransferase
MFALLIGMAIMKYLQSVLSKAEFKYFFIIAALLAPFLVFVTVVCLTVTGVVAPWSGRYSVRCVIGHKCCI